MIQALSRSLRLTQRSFFNFSVKRFTEEHEWITLEKSSSLAKVGITDYAQSQLGDIVHIDGQKIGKEVKKMESLGTVESVKVAADIYSPLDCEIVSLNKSVLDNPQIVNQDALKNWIIEVKLKNTSDFDKLWTEEQYNAFLAKSKH